MKSVAWPCCPGCGQVPPMQGLLRHLILIWPRHVSFGQPNKMPRSFLFGRSCEIKNMPQPGPGRPCEKNMPQPRRAGLRKKTCLSFPGQDLPNPGPIRALGSQEMSMGSGQVTKMEPNMGAKMSPKRGPKRGPEEHPKSSKTLCFPCVFARKGGPKGPPKRPPKRSKKGARIGPGMGPNGARNEAKQGPEWSQMGPQWSQRLSFR